ncbi:SWI/SNF complex subunit SWI3D isoform X1 [Cynara cardunculus var. scolymus]|uniref:SWI/SNF complex subunit SWI3D isoform X1 n=1 Tax=Cynara cardunculus var. scolymus TaxID=59895 RepID=UPI000D623CF3|nr:SWI/SNF complex subunit SWI3D isoform X1 [Cynara cardunculus var. scolymus]
MEEKHNSPATATEAATPSSAELPSSRRRGGGLKRKASILSNSNTSTPPPSLSSKRQAREKPSPVLFPPIHNGPCTRARQQPNYADSTSFWDAVIVNGEGEGSMLGTPVAAKVEEELNARKEAWEALEAKMEAEYDHLKARDANSQVVPISCGWFSWTKVHQLEEKAMPSFFNGEVENRTPELYMEIRNSIMKRFHANPNTEIEAKDLSEISIGELDAKEEVMEFLEYWGLINYHPFPEADITSSMGDAEEAAKVNSLIQNLYEFEVEQLCPPAAPRTSLATLAVPSRLPESMITDESVQPEGPSVEYHCNSCAADCSRKRYHCQKQADFDLCTDCFNDGKFDSDMSPSDFIIMEPADAAGASSGKWTDQETLLLLEALELFSENWNEIAEHVATKTKAQCILHFVQMPIEDTFRDCDDEDDASNKEKAEKKDASPDENDEKKEVDASPEENVDKVEVDVNLKEKTDAVAIKNDTPLGDSPDMKETDDPKALLNTDALPPDDAPSNNDEPDPSPMDISESADPDKLKDNQENGVNIAVKALREAFDAVGSRPSHDGKLSFADAGNPVMAMAAFLSRLVDPNIVTASARTSLKSVSSGGTGLQLSARHSFVIEHPTDEKKPDNTERDVQEKVEQEGMKDKTDSSRKQEEEKSSLILSDSSVNDDNDKEGKKESSVSHGEKKNPIPAEVVLPKKGKNVGRKGISASSKKDKDPITEKAIIAAETNEQTDQIENPSSSKKESEGSADGGPPLGVSRSTEAPKDEEMVSKSLPSETAEPHQSNTSLAENTANSEEAGAKDCKNVNKHPLDTKDDPDMHKLTSAAVTAISAAAVKAKFLADQEEDQIRQLATSLIEKQLHKLETKLAFFTEMDGVVARVREQMERSKQRLYHERAQIIAARLGMSSAASTRPMPHPLPNRGGMPFPNAVQRPPSPMSMTPQRPPLSRPMMAPTPFSNPIIPSTVAGNSAQISNNPDKLSSVGMK